jgi:hypothetical protein
VTSFALQTWLLDAAQTFKNLSLLHINFSPITSGFKRFSFVLDCLRASFDLFKVLLSILEIRFSRMDLFPFEYDYDELPPLIDPAREITDPNNPYNFTTGRNIAMPSECTTNPLQRALADSIIRMVSLDELRILFACGAKVRKFRQSNCDGQGR